MARARPAPRRHARLKGLPLSHSQLTLGRNRGPGSPRPAGHPSTLRSACQSTTRTSPESSTRSPICWRSGARTPSASGPTATPPGRCGACPRSSPQMVEAGADLTELPGIGEALAGKIGEIVRTGTCEALKKLERELPPDLTELLRLPGLGTQARPRPALRPGHPHPRAALPRRQGRAPARAVRLRPQDRGRHRRRPGGAPLDRAPFQAGHRRPLRGAPGRLAGADTGG